MAKIKLNFKKIDLSAVKQFLLAKGEKVALGLFAAIGLTLVVVGFLAAKNSNRTSDGKVASEELLKHIVEVRKTITNNAPAPDDPTITGLNFKTEWLKRDFDFPFRTLVPVTEQKPPKRKNPTALPLLAGKGSTQVDYIKAAVQVYDVVREEKKVWVVISSKDKDKDKDKEEKKPFSGRVLETLRPKSVLVISSMFPFNDQLKEFEKSLRVPLSDMQPKTRDFPVLLGYDVIRIEKVDDVDPKTKEKVQKDVEMYLYKFDEKKGTSRAAPHIDDLLREARVDEEALQPFENHFQPGMMQIPVKLAMGSYPPLKLANYVRPDPTTKKGNDAGKIKGIVRDKNKVDADGNAVKIDIGDLADIPKEGASVGVGVGFTGAGPKSVGDGKSTDLVSLRKRFEGDYSIFFGDVGAYHSDKDGRANPGPQGAGVRNMGTNLNLTAFQPGLVKDDKDPNMVGKEPEIKYPDVLVRFMDVDVKPGTSYEYRVTMYMRNPNLGRKTEVAQEDHASVAVIPSKETVIKYRVPTSSDEMRIYANNQYFLPEAKAKAKENEKKIIIAPKDAALPQPCGPDTRPLDEKHAHMQLHRWFGAAPNPSGDDYVIAEWVVAERVLVRRGEYIGRDKLSVPAVTWSKLKEDFEVILPPAVEGKPAIGGISLSFLTSPAPVLVDFEGGIKQASTGGFAGQKVREECAMDLLILNADGSLTMRNSQMDRADPERLRSYEAYRGRLKQFTTDPDAEGPNRPNGGGIIKKKRM